jgi:rod shape-determining protein MreD
MSLLVAAIGATVTAIFELTVGPYLRVGDAQPHFVLVYAIIWTVAVGLESGLAAAFVGGIVLDALAQRPLGVSPFALIVCVGVAAVVARALARIRPIIVVPVVALLSLVYSMTSFVLLGVLRMPIAIGDPIATLLPGVAYDALFAIALGPLAIALYDRYAGEERVDW